MFVIASEAAKEMLARLAWVLLEPRCILNVGCAVDSLEGALKARYPAAEIITIDLHTLKAEQTIQRILSQADQTVDLICANLLLPWTHDITFLFRQCKRLLREEGLFSLTALGVDSLKECRTVYPAKDMPQLLDMHDIGDLLVQSKFADPVLDVDYCVINYSDPKRLVEELCLTGMLTKSPAAYESALLPASNEGKWPVSYELIYAHAWMPALIEEDQARAGQLMEISLSDMKRRLRESTGSL